MIIKVGEYDVLVDDADYERLSQYKWYACSARNGARKWVSRSTWDGKKARAINISRDVLRDYSDMHVDHVNGDPLDNRRINLRLCTNQQNLMNRGPNKNNTSGYKGVYLSSSGNRWIAQLRLSGKPIYLGSFSNKHEAARAYNKAALSAHGEFAHLNTIKEMQMK